MNHAELNEYTQIMEQVDYPNGVKSHHPVVCTQQQADDEIGKIYQENPSWRTIEMRFVKRSELTNYVKNQSQVN